MSSASPTPDVLRLFGPPRLEGGDGERALEWQVPVALLAYLALRPGWHSRESLAQVLRPEANTQTARAYLWRLIHRMREVLPPLEGLQIEDSRLRFEGPSDVGQFEQAVEQGQWPLAVQLQGQPLLHNTGSTGLAGLDDWFYEERLRLRQRLGTALMAWIAQQQQEGRDSAELMQRLGEHDALDENAAQFLLERAKTPLERHAAASTFQTLQRRMAAELGLKPLAKTLQLYQGLHDGVSFATAPAQTSAAAPAFLPATPLARLPEAAEAAPLGREAELAALGELLAREQVRLITIYGFGGVGKTSLARALHAQLRRSGTSCAWVDLLAVDTLHAMLDAIASQVGMSARDGSVHDQLAHWLAARRIVVFLDNFEQLVAHAGVLAGLLQAAPGARFVVTSREALRLGEEYSFALAGLGFQGPQSPAARLFALHAQRMGHTLARADHQPIAELVEYLEGLPLAIELAANWITLLPASSILAELRADPAFIDSAEVPSGRSMRAVFNAAWRRLDAHEQDALASLSTVLGAMDLETARAIAQADAPVFLRLVGKSLLQRSPQGLFRLHPLVREFAKAQTPAVMLAAAGLRHAEHFLGRLAQPPALRTGQYMPQRIAHLLPQAEDIAKAWRFAADTGRQDLLEAGVTNLAGLLFSAYRYEEAAELARHAAAGPRGNQALAGVLAAMHALAAFRLGRMAEAEAVAKGALELRPSENTQARLNVCLARIYWFRGQYEPALAYGQRAYDAASEGDVYVRMMAAEELAKCHYSLGQLDRADALLSTNLALSRQHDAKHVEGRSLCLLGIIKDAAGFSEEALSFLDSSLQIFRSMNDHYQMAYVLRGMSYSYFKVGRLDRQMDTAQAALDTFKAAGHHHEIGESLFALVFAHDAAGRHPQALAACREALKLCLQANNMPAALRCVAALGAFAAVVSRPWGLGVMGFAAQHPSWRKPDESVLKLRLAALGVSAAEWAQTLGHSRGWTFEYVCGRLLEETA